MPLVLPALPLGRGRDDEDDDDDPDDDPDDPQNGPDPAESGDEEDRVPVIPWSDEDGDADSWDAGELPWGSTEPTGQATPADDPDEDDGNWDDLGWPERAAETQPEPEPVDDDFARPAMSSWQRRKSAPVKAEDTDVRSGGAVEPPPEELEELWARRRAEADARRESLRQLREGRSRDEAEDDDAPPKEIVPKSAGLLRQADSVWGAGDDESGVIG